MRLPDDLHQRHPGPVEIDEAHLDAIRVSAVDEPASVLFDVDACNTGPPCLAPAYELKMTFDCQREIELRYLVSLRQVRIEVVLAIELTEGWDHAVERDPGQDRCLDCRPVQHRQCARETTADHADVGVRKGVRIPGRAATVHLGFREQ